MTIRIETTNVGGGVSSFNDFTDLPTTLAGYGITDAASLAHVTAFLSGSVITGFARTSGTDTVRLRVGTTSGNYHVLWWDGSITNHAHDTEASKSTAGGYANRDVGFIIYSNGTGRLSSINMTTESRVKYLNCSQAQSLQTIIFRNQSEFVTMILDTLPSLSRLEIVNTSIQMLSAESARLTYQTGTNTTTTTTTTTPTYSQQNQNQNINYVVTGGSYIANNPALYDDVLNKFMAGLRETNAGYLEFDNNGGPFNTETFQASLATSKGYVVSYTPPS